MLFNSVVILRACRPAVASRRGVPSMVKAPGGYFLRGKGLAWLPHLSVCKNFYGLFGIGWLTTGRLCGNIMIGDVERLPFGNF